VTPTLASMLYVWWGVRVRRPDYRGERELSPIRRAPGRQPRGNPGEPAVRLPDHHGPRSRMPISPSGSRLTSPSELMQTVQRCNSDPCTANPIRRSSNSIIPAPHAQTPLLWPSRHDQLAQPHGTGGRATYCKSGRANIVYCCRENGRRGGGEGCLSESSHWGF
jgi:hypothetical protein